jgi:hypothetical protein
MTASALCLNLGTVEYKGVEYEFLDPNGNGVMTFEEAGDQDMPIEFFRMINVAGDGNITSVEYKRYQREQRMLSRAGE